MKCLAAVGLLLVTAWTVESGAICGRSDQDSSCLTEKQHKEPEQVVPSQSVLSPRDPPTECLAGTEWESNCHSCKCTNAGVAECLKQSSCDKDVTGEPISCKPESTFQRDCNTCVCLENGARLCTVEVCSTVPKKSDLKTGKECASGTFWKSQCNDCGCSPDGFHFCTQKNCFGQEQEPVMRCQPDTMWLNDCNTCWCTSNGKPFCTKIGCDAVAFEIDDKSKSPVPVSTLVSRKKRASVQETPKTCQPGQEFQMDCNTCLCDNEGQDFSCTRIDCVAQNNNQNKSRKKRGVTQTPQKCEPSAVFYNDCNLCQCSADGTMASCTNNPCPKSTPAPEADPGYRCNPGELFKNECNDCTCSADGKNIFCTLRLCDAAIIQA